MSVPRGPNRIRVEGDVAYIQLTGRRNEPVAESAIDVADVPKVRDSGLRWHANWDKNYGQHKVGAHVKVDGRWSGRILLHRFLLDAPKGVDVDHVDHDLLNNRRSNLRLCSRGLNMQNRAGATRSSRSGVRNVYAEGGGWRVQIKLNGRARYFGTYDTIEEAERAAIAVRRAHMTHSDGQRDPEAGLRS